jgi:hypothetical protein
MNLTINENKLSLTDGEAFFDTTYPEWFDVSKGIISISSNIKEQLVATYGSEQDALLAAQETALKNTELEYPETFEGVINTVWMLAFMSCQTPDS